jgi:hypothetical protein
LEKIEIWIVPKIISPISPQDIATIFSTQMKERLKDFNFNIRIVSEGEIVRSHRGKLMMIMQELKI